MTIRYESIWYRTVSDDLDVDEISIDRFVFAYYIQPFPGRWRYRFFTDIDILSPVANVFYFGNKTQINYKLSVFDILNVDCSDVSFIIFFHEHQRKINTRDAQHTRNTVTSVFLPGQLYFMFLVIFLFYFTWRDVFLKTNRFAWFVRPQRQFDHVAITFSESIQRSRCRLGYVCRSFHAHYIDRERRVSYTSFPVGKPRTGRKERSCVYGTRQDRLGQVTGQMPVAEKYSKSLFFISQRSNVLITCVNTQSIRLILWFMHFHQVGRIDVARWLLNTIQRVQTNLLVCLIYNISPKFNRIFAVFSIRYGAIMIV